MMDEITILIFLGFVLSGVIVGYPLGHIVGRRAARRELFDECDAHLTYDLCGRQPEIEVKTEVVQ